MNVRIKILDFFEFGKGVGHSKDLEKLTHNGNNGKNTLRPYSEYRVHSLFFSN